MKRLAVVTLVILVCPSLFADAASAKKKLERGGNELTIDAFFTAIFMNEPKTVALYLEAGMPPDAANDKGVTAVHRAVDKDDTKILEMLIKAGANVNAAAENGDTPLCEAADDGTPKHVDLLIKAGADVNAVCSDKKTALHEAASDANLAMVQLLLAAKANVDARSSRNETALHLASDEDKGAPVVQALIAAGADVNARNNQGETPLHEAVSSDRAEIGKLLLDAGANPNVKNAGGRSPLYEAVQFGRPKIVPVLLAGGANFNEKADGKTLLQIAKSEGNAEIIAALENAKPVAPKAVAASAKPAAAPTGDPVAQLKKMGITTIDAATLHKRVEARDARAAALLIAAGVKPSVRDNVGRPPLYNAIENDDVEMVKALIAAGADPNDPGKAARAEFESGQTLLMLAVDEGDPELVSALLAAGAKPDAANMYASNALMGAAMQGKADIAKVLIDGKANVNAVDSAGTPILYMAVMGKNPEVVQMLLDAGAKLGTKKKLITDAAAESGNDQIRAIIGKAAGTTVAAKAPPARPTPKPNSAKKTIGAKELYDKIVVSARKWQSDAELNEMGTLGEAGLDPTGKSFSWNVDFYSRSASKLKKYMWDDGKLTEFETPTNQLPVVNVRESTIFDSKRLLDIAEENGGATMTARNIRPSVGLVNNPIHGALWYFNYSDPETRKNVMTIVIAAGDGRVVLKDAK